MHQFCGFDSGAWSFSARQYIPSDFASGGTDPFAGSYLVLLNTYSAGGPHQPSDWSVQMQFDSNDGMLKVFHGDGVNTIVRPYITDQWVKIDVIVDLDNDWTWIYYDGSLVTEYSWTGGVLGGGGGALDIAAVDLYANSSTAVYWENSLLETFAVDPCPNGDPDTDLEDFALFQACFTGAGGGPVAVGCVCLDADLDNDVDRDDFAAFMATFNGPQP